MPDWDSQDPKKAKQNAKEAMDNAQKWLDIPQVCTLNIFTYAEKWQGEVYSTLELEENNSLHTSLRLTAFDQGLLFLCKIGNYGLQV